MSLSAVPFLRGSRRPPSDGRRAAPRSEIAGYLSSRSKLRGIQPKRLKCSNSHKRIAEELGFCDEFHFSKIFCKRMGLFPQAFRLKALGSAKK